MRTFWSFSGLLTIATLWLSSALVGAPQKSVDVATLSDYPPLCFPVVGAPSSGDEEIAPGGDSKIIQGYSWDVIRTAFHRQGYTIKLHVASWPRAMEMVKQSTYDVVFPAGRNPDREKTYLYSQEPVNKVNYVIYFNKDKKVDWHGVSSVAGMRVATFRGWTYGEEFDKATNFKKIESNAVIDAAFKNLKEGRIDAVAGYDLVFDAELKKLNMSNDYAKTPSFGTSTEFLIGAKSNSKVPAIISVFDEAKRELEKDGTLKKITAKWM